MSKYRVQCYANGESYESVFTADGFVVEGIGVFFKIGAETVGFVSMSFIVVVQKLTNE